MLDQRPLVESAVDTWTNTALDYIRQTFGEDSAHQSTFIGHVLVRVVHGTPRYDAYAEQEEARKLQERLTVLDILLS